MHRGECRLGCRKLVSEPIDVGDRVGALRVHKLLPRLAQRSGNQFSFVLVVGVNSAPSPLDAFQHRHGLAASGGASWEKTERAKRQPPLEEDPAAAPCRGAPRTQEAPHEDRAARI